MIRLPLFSVLIISLFAQTALAAPPVVDTTISVEKTGSEPFDATTWDGSDLSTAGTDADENNGVVRLQDSITYKVELSVNDGLVDEMIATVLLDKKQAWIEIPTGCKSPPDVVTPSSISADGRTLICNTGSAIEGTTKVVYPAARAIGASFDGTEITLNDDVVGATVSNQATGPEGASNVATDGPAETIVTAFFRVDTYKTPKVDAVDSDTGAWIYKATRQDGPAGEPGVLMEFRIRTRYVQGSMIADAPNEAGGDFEMDYDIFDVYSDNNDNNNASGSGANLSTGGILYTWNPAVDPCFLDGDHGPAATVTCTQNNVAIDFTGPTLNPDGINDPNIDIDLDNIDVRDPDNDSNLINMVINIWFSRADDILTHQGCVGTVCTTFVINEVGVLNGGTVEGFNPVSTEDASSTNLLNYNGAPGEPLPNEIEYPMSYPGEGPWGLHKTFYGFTSSGTPKELDQQVAPGELVPFLMRILDYRFFDGATSEICDKIDTSVYEFVGPTEVPSTNLNATDGNRANFNPSFRIYTSGDTAAEQLFTDAAPFTKSLYSSEPHMFATSPTVPVAPSTDYLEALRDDDCEDDVNGDGQVNIMDASGVESNPGNPVDWYEDFNMLPGGPSAVTKVKGVYEQDNDASFAIDPEATNIIVSWFYYLRVLPTLLGGDGYGADDRLPNFMVGRKNDGPGQPFDSWRTSPNPVDDPDRVEFSIDPRYSDRNILVASAQSIQKYTDPVGLKVVRSGDLVSFVIEPRILGNWAGVETADVTDPLPTGTDYVLDSEEFSIDGGVTWLNHADYLASSPVVTLTSAPNLTSTLAWTFGDLEQGEQLPLIRYQVLVDPTLTSGSFANTSTLSSALGVDDDGDTISDDVDATYSISIVPEFGFDVSKYNRQDVYSVNSPFWFDVIYKNLGGEDYSAGDFIDILPYNGDGSGLLTSGVASTRMPESIFDGTYEVTELVGANGETFYATNAAPTTIVTDPCHEDNQPAGYAPIAGDLCFEFYTNNGGAFAGGGAVGTGLITWDLCTALAPPTCGAIVPGSITAIRFTTPAIPTSAGGSTVSFEITPTGNLGGTPDIDSESNVTALSTGNIYTNTFGGRIPEISLNVISNDVSVTMISGSIGNYIWFDISNDGLQDSGEPPLENVEVALTDVAGNPIYIDPVTGAVVTSTWPGAIPYVVTTDSNGEYLFENLPPGDYNVTINPATLPSGMTSTADPDGGADNTSAYTLSEELSGAGVLLDVEDNDTQDFGYYVPPSSLGDTVWIDTDGDGVQDPTEVGIAGVTVTLFCFGPDGLPGGGDDITYTTMTDASGNYLFPNLLPYDYQVQFTPPAGFSFSPNDAGGDDDLDSDADPFTGVTPVISIGVGEDVTNVDAGLVEDPTVASLGDTVWFDENGDGIQDPGESGVAGVVVTATYFGPDGLPGGGDDQVFTMTTDANGNYLFTNLPPGDYKVTFAPPAGFDFTTNDVGGDDSLDSDADPLTGMSSVVTLNAGDVNLTVDAGLVEADNSGLASVLWNGFCDQQNFVSMTNVCFDPVTVTIALYGSTGGLLSSEVVTISAGQQIDHSINDMVGFSMFDYGRADLLSMPGGCVSGDMGLFAPISSGQFFSTSIEDGSLGGEANLFAMSDGTMSNACYAGFNTFQPSLDPEDQFYPTTHYLQLVNLEREQKLSFAVKRFDMFGAEISSEQVTLEPGGRQDISAGHEDTELSRYGIVEVIPSEPGADYNAQMFRYGVDTSTMDGERMSSFSLADNCSVGESGVQYVTVSRGAGASNWLELHNINRASERVSINVYSNTGGQVGSYSFDLEGLQTVHFDAGEGLLDGESGVAEVRSVNDSRLLVKSTSYIYRADGKILSSETASGRTPVGIEASGSYNSFRNQLNWLRMFNVSSSDVSVTVVGYDQLMNQELGREEVSLAGLSGRDIDLNGLFSLGSTDVGRVRIVSSKAQSIVADIVRVQHDDNMQLEALEIFDVK